MALTISKTRPLAFWRGHDLRSAHRLAELASADALLGPAGRFVLIPAGTAIYLSLTNEALSGAAALNPRFVGARNYPRLFTDDGFWNSLLVTASSFSDPRSSASSCSASSLRSR